MYAAVFKSASRKPFSVSYIRCKAINIISLELPKLIVQTELRAIKPKPNRTDMTSNRAETISQLNC